MTRSAASTLALGVLLGLTALSFVVAESELGPWPIAALIVVKASVIGVVFLEMDRSWPGWALAGFLLISRASGTRPRP